MNITPITREEGFVPEPNEYSRDTVKQIFGDIERYCEQKEHPTQVRRLTHNRVSETLVVWVDPEYIFYCRVTVKEYYLLKSMLRDAA